MATLGATPSTTTFPTGEGSLALLETKTASNSASLDFTSRLVSTYDNYLLILNSVLPATNAANLQLRVSSDNGSTWIQGTSYSASYMYIGGGGGIGAVDSLDTSAFIIAAANKNSLNGASGRLGVFGPLLAQYTQLIFAVNQINSGDSLPYTYTGGGAYKVTTAINALQVAFNSGNITSGSVSLYGYTK